MTRTSDGPVEAPARPTIDPGLSGATGVRDIGTSDPRYRRRPALIGLGVGLLAVCGAGAAYLAQLSGDTTQVLAVAADVHRGEIITAEDLTIARAAPDPAVAPVPADRRDGIVGQHAAADLTAGTLLTESAVTSAAVPAAGETVVGVAVTEAQLPQHEMVPGDPVRIFDTPNPGDDPPAESPPSIPATVVSVSGITDHGQVIVDVVVDDDVAGELAARVATGRVAIVLDSAQEPDAASDEDEQQ